MTIITQGTINTVALTLFEMQTGTTNIFLFQFINKASQQAFYCVATGLSTTYRYQAFSITETNGAVADPTLSQVNLSIKGQYDYYVYENPNNVLDPNGLNLCEVGMVIVTGPEIIIPAYSPDTSAVFYNSN